MIEANGDAQAGPEARSLGQQTRVSRKMHPRCRGCRAPPSWRSRRWLVRWRKSFDGPRSRGGTRDARAGQISRGTGAFGRARTRHPGSSALDAGRLGVPRGRLLDLICGVGIVHRQCGWLRRLLRTRPFERQPALSSRLPPIGSAGVGRAVCLVAHSAVVYLLAYHGTLRTTLRAGDRLDDARPFTLPLSFFWGCSLVS